MSDQPSFTAPISDVLNYADVSSCPIFALAIRILRPSHPVAYTWNQLATDIAFATGGLEAGFLTVPSGVSLSSSGFPNPAEYPWVEDGNYLSKIMDRPWEILIDFNSGENWFFLPLFFSSRFGLVLWIRSPAGKEWTAEELRSLKVLAQNIKLTPEVWESPGEVTQAVERFVLQEKLHSTGFVTGLLAHEFGNLVTGLLGFGELALSNIPGQTTAHGFISEVCQSGKRAVQWVESLQIFARRRPFGFHSAPFKALIADLEAWMKPRITPEMKFSIQVPEDLPLLAIEEAIGKRLMQNILQNSCEAMRGVGEISLSARQVELSAEKCMGLFGNCSPGHFVEIVVRDSGHGLKKETVRRVFTEPFYSSKHRHRGLGIPTTYGIAYAFGGGFSIQQPDIGTTFTLYLPVVASQKPTTGAAGETG